VILRKYKNTLLAIIQESGFDPALFSAQDGTLDKEQWFIIQLRDSLITFAVRPYSTYLDQFETRKSYYLKNFPLGYPSRGNTLQALSNLLKEWLNDVVEPYLDELNTPDLWQALQDTLSQPIGQLQPPLDLEPFSEEEKIQLRLSIDKLQLSIQNSFELQKKELATVHKLLQHLSQAADKHNRFDWRGIAINVAVTIALHLALNPQQTRELLQLFKDALSNITYLLP
jgi:hypothetical protein